MPKPLLHKDQYKLLLDRISAVSLIMENLLQQHPVAKIEIEIKDQISASIDELYKAALLVKKNC
jgi:hypothetical protein|tara:strand:+ start:5038 stop:5229 length:192 start_codon:yes stop_codon:yes gene_type:complete